MARTKSAPTAPAWFRPEAYDAAAPLDAGDWLLNLTLRCWLRNEPNPATEKALREVGPVLRRGDAAQVRAMHLADVHRWIGRFNASEWGGDPLTPHYEACQRPELPPDVWHALQHGRIGDGINPLGCVEMYTFERMLPDNIRAAGAKFKPGDYAGQYPQAFNGTLDDAFGDGPAKQMLGRFVRVDLGLPDDVLIADLQRYLKHERQRLAAMGDPQREYSYREAARLKAKPAPRTLATFAGLHLLAYLDLSRWAAGEPKKSHGARLSEYDLMALAGVASARRAELREYARLAGHQMQLHALFARLDRSARRRATRARN